MGILQQKEVIFETINAKNAEVGLITLNRPQALNALSQNMCVQIYNQLHMWRDDKNIKAVIIKGAGDRAFCAGGDIRKLYENRDQPLELKQEFFWHEYRLNHAIFSFPKPYIAILDGIAMGGGLGISANGSYRIATERLQLAMPETLIGLFPDSGASYFLTSIVNRVGWYLGLTGNTIQYHDAFALGLVNYVFTIQSCKELLSAITELTFSHDPHYDIKKLLNTFHVEPPAAELDYDLINECFESNDIDNILNKLKEKNNEWCNKTYTQFMRRSPTSLKVVAEQLKRGSQLEFDDCIRMEYRLVTRFLQSHDLYEGIRSVIIDRDKKPSWQPASLSEVDEGQVLKYFEPLVQEIILD